MRSFSIFKIKSWIFTPVINCNLYSGHVIWHLKKFTKNIKWLIEKLLTTHKKNAIILSFL